MLTLRDRSPAAAPFSRERFLEVPLAQLAGCTLRLVCHDGCTRPGRLDLTRAAQHYGRRPQLRSVIARLRCRACKRPPAQVAISGPKLDGMSTWSVVLVP